MFGRWLYLYACFLQTLAYPPEQILNLYQEAQKTPFSHQIWISHTIEEDVQPIAWERPVRQAQGCQAPGGQRGRCVRMEDCVLRNIHLDYVKNKDYFCVQRNRDIGVCCPDTIRTPTRYREGLFATLPANYRPSSSGPIMFEEQQQQPTPVAPNRIPDDIYPLGDFRVCGRNGKHMSSVTAAAPTTVKDWPWMAALVYRSTFKQFCGGTVITRRHVLTAAHCFPRADPNEVVVLLGDYDLKRKDDSKSKAFSVVQMLIHEDFDVTTFENDITILVLDSASSYNSFVQPCCLPAPNNRFTDTTAVVTGWGKLEFGGRSPSILQEVPVPIWNQERCVPNFAQTIFNTSLCAGAFEGGKDSCQGDSGGPLVVQRSDDRWTIIGIVSWGINCGEKNHPGIYTRVNDYLDWIAQSIL